MFVFTRIHKIILQVSESIWGLNFNPGIVAEELQTKSYLLLPLSHYNHKRQQSVSDWRGLSSGSYTEVIRIVHGN